MKIVFRLQKFSEFATHFLKINEKNLKWERIVVRRAVAWFIANPTNASKGFLTTIWFLNALIFR